MKYRKKPVVIDAVQYLTENSEAMLELLNGCTGWHLASGGIVIPTLEGKHTASPGDWVIKGVKGEYYPCKPDIFAMTYEPVEESTAYAEPYAEPEEDADYRRRKLDVQKAIDKQDEEESPDTIGFSPWPMPSMPEPEPDTSSSGQGFAGFGGGGGFDGGGGGSSWGGGDTSTPADFGDVSGGSSSTSD